MKTIAVIRTGGIGDVILSFVSLSVIRHNYPGASILWVGREPTLDLVRNAFPEVIPVNIRSGNTYRQNLTLIRNSTAQIDLVIDLQRSARSILLCALLRMKFNFRYVSWNKYSLPRSLFVLQAKLRGRKNNISVYAKKLLSRRQAMAQCTLAGLNKLNISADWSIDYFPNIDTGEKKEMRIAVCLGSLFPLKELPLERVIEFIRYLVDAYGTYSIVLLGSEDKHADGERIIQKLDSALHIENICGKTTLWRAASILQSCKFSLANDSALAHLSESVGTPVLMFFGPTHECFGYSPYLEKSRPFSLALGCRPCHKDGNRTCSFGDDKCRKDVNVSVLFPHINYLLHD
jgi:ADP-heptose:LPS heptosyltransferase